MKIGIIGTGYVGLPTGVGLAELGNTVVCVDKIKEKIDALKAGQLTIFEDGLAELFAKNTANGRLSFTTSMKKAIEGADVYIADDLALLVHLRRAGLAADPVAGDCGILAAALLHDRLQQFPHSVACFRPNGRSPHRRSRPLQDLALRGLYLRHQIGLHQLAAVDAGVRRHHQLQGRDRHALTEADACQIDVFHISGADQDAPALPRQINSRGLAQTEGR